MSERNNSQDSTKIIKVEDGNLTRLHRAITIRSSRDFSTDDQNEDSEHNADADWFCIGCGKRHSSERRRCFPPCRRWKGGTRNISGKKAAEQLPFETLEEIYRKRKRQRTTIDLTKDNSGPFEPDESDNALRNMAKQAEAYSSKLIAVKKENEDTKDDLEDANELVQPTTLTADIWMSRYDELAEKSGLDPKIINEIRNRPLSSGR